MNIERVVAAVRASLTDDLRRPRYRGDPNPMRGHCYVAAEAVYHICAPMNYLTPMTIRVATDEVHWALRTRDGGFVDPTFDQFTYTPNYRLGRLRGFLTKQPSRRGRIVIERARAWIEQNTDPLETFLLDMRATRVPSFEWSIKHAPDGNCEAAVGRLWLSATSPVAMMLLLCAHKSDRWQTALTALKATCHEMSLWDFCHGDDRDDTAKAMLAHIGDPDDNNPIYVAAIRRVVPTL